MYQYSLVYRIIHSSRFRKYPISALVIQLHRSTCHLALMYDKVSEERCFSFSEVGRGTPMLYINSFFPILSTYTSPSPTDKTICTIIDDVAEILR